MKNDRKFVPFDLNDKIEIKQKDNIVFQHFFNAKCFCWWFKMFKKSKYFFIINLR